MKDPVVDLLKLKDEDIQSYALVRASLLQKLIRRGMTAQALWTANLFITDGHQKGLRRKLYQICAEDIGLGNPYLLSELIKEENWQVMVTKMCLSHKNRETNRFHVITKYNPKYFVNKSESTKAEARLLWNLLKASKEWIENKRSKEKKQTLERLFDELKENNTVQPDTIEDCKVTYIELARAGTFSCDDVLSLAVLLSTRNPKKENIIVNSIPSMSAANPVPQFALDRHTSYGKKLGRGWEHWEKEGVVVYPEITYDSLKDENGIERYPHSEFMGILKKL